jgi:hypothetical protein
MLLRTKGGITIPQGWPRSGWMGVW